MMKVHRRTWAALALAGCVLTAGSAQAAVKLLTIEEAQKMSKTTGRPIFAVAGSET